MLPRLTMTCSKPTFASAGAHRARRNPLASTIDLALGGSCLWTNGYQDSSLPRRQSENQEGGRHSMRALRLSALIRAKTMPDGFMSLRPSLRRTFPSSAQSSAPTTTVKMRHFSPGVRAICLRYPFGPSMRPGPETMPGGSTRMPAGISGEFTTLSRNGAIGRTRGMSIAQRRWS